MTNLDEPVLGGQKNTVFAAVFNPKGQLKVARKLSINANKKQPVQPTYPQTKPYNRNPSSPSTGNDATKVFVEALVKGHRLYLPVPLVKGPGNRE